jgi:hypothetical protein
MCVCIDWAWRFRQKLLIALPTRKAASVRAATYVKSKVQGQKCMSTILPTMPSKCDFSAAAAILRYGLPKGCPPKSMMPPLKILSTVSVIFLPVAYQPAVVKRLPQQRCIHHQVVEI